MELTNDPLLVTRVYASFPLDAIFDSEEPKWDDSSDDYDSKAFDQALTNAYDILNKAIAETFPNATDIWVECTGWEGAWAQFSPRADSPDLDMTYEPFYDWLVEVQDRMFVTE